MFKKVSTIEEAWAFMMSQVKKGPSFQVHTNKKGIRVWLGSDSFESGGFYTEHRIRVSDEVDADGDPKREVHKSDLIEVPCCYGESEMGKDLIEAVNKHIDKFIGDVHVPSKDESLENACCRITKVTEKSLKEFRKMPVFEYGEGFRYREHIKPKKEKSK